MKVIKHRKKFFILSSVVILVGLIMMVAKGFDEGIDFTGGTLIQIDFGKEVPVAEVREISNALDPNADIIHAGDNNQEVIIKTTKDMNNDERLAFFQKYASKYNLKDDALKQSERFTASIGQELKNKAFLSVIIATLCMLVYITIRFEFKFGLAAVIALVHDVLVMLSAYAILRITVNGSFVAAILTIVGYSINDTIVVFDRIRENIGNFKRNQVEELIDTSITQTITRTINTSATTLMSIIFLYIFGVDAIRNFALPLIIGIAVGTYSSIFIASPLWYEFTMRVKERKSA